MNKHSELNTLGLDDDLDGVELLIELEAVFNIAITDDDAQKMLTVGDLYDTISQKLSIEGGDKCLSQLAFYQLRRTLSPLAPEMKLSPSTVLQDITAQSPRKLIRLIKKSTGLNSPPIEKTALGSFGFFVLCTSLIVIPFLNARNQEHWLIGSTIILSCIVSISLLYFDAGKFSKHNITLGELAHSYSTYNYGKLVQLGGKKNETSMWNTLVDITLQHSTELGRSDINRETTLLHPQHNA